MNAATALAAFAAICAAHPDGVVTVTNGAASAAGFRGSVSGQSDMSGIGEHAPRNGSVHVSSAAIGTVAPGSVLTIGSDEAQVTSARVDPLGALVRIEYQIPRPLVGV